MKTRNRIFWAAALVLCAASGVAAAQNLAHGRAVVTVLPKHEGASVVVAPQVSPKIDGKPAQVIAWRPYAANDKVELVILLDSGLRTNVARQMDDLRKFAQTLPPNVSAAFAYMQNGRSVFERPFSNNPAVILQSLHLPIGMAGSSASPYFCLSDLAKNWPSNDGAARREVLMVTDGVDLYHPVLDPEDPYLQSAIRDAVAAHLIVDSIYWQMEGRPGPRVGESFVGQALLQIAAEATGGKSFYMGTGNPVTFGPYFDELKQRLGHQYELVFTAPAGRKADIGALRLKLRVPDAEVTVPSNVWLIPELK